MSKYENATETKTERGVRWRERERERERHRKRRGTDREEMIKSENYPETK